MVEQPTSSSDFDGIFKLRAEVWRAIDSDLPKEKRHYWKDEIDGSASHFIVKNDGIVIAAARLHIFSSLGQVPHFHVFVTSRNEISSPFGFLSRLVVDPNHRRMGIGHALDEIRLERAKESNCGTALLIYTLLSGESRRLAVESLGGCVLQPTRHPNRDLLLYPVMFKL